MLTAGGRFGGGLAFHDSLRVNAHPSDVLRICIPVHNEATTIGVLLWRLRSVFQGFSREYDVVVYDDASTDGTDEVLEPYRSVMPLTVLRSGTHRGYAASIDALVRHVAADDEYARRDAMVLLQGDFTESPEHLPELVKRFEGGADLVAVHRTMSDATPADERRLRRWGRWAVTPFLRLPPVADPFTGFRLVRISVLRELLRALGSRPVCAGDGWAANIDFALNVSPFARRIENVEFAPRYDVRQRASRRRGWPDVIELFHWARGARRIARPVPGGKAVEASGRTPADATPVSTPTERSARPAVTVRPDQSGRPPREQRPARADRPPREERAPRAERPPRDPRPPRPERPPREAKAATATATTAVPEPDELLTTVVGAPELGDLQLEAIADASASSEKRSRRRRRRSRRGRESKNADGSSVLETTDGLVGSPYAADAESGTSDESEGPDDGDGDGDGDDAAMVESGAVNVEPGAEAAKRKKRLRRRRRGRRPGGPDAAGTDTDPPPPAAEPPSA